MADRQPPNVIEGAEPPESLPANAEDRKAAQALSGLDVKGDDDSSQQPKKELDHKALSDAMKNLAVEPTEKKAASKPDEAPKKPLVKVDPADVALLVEHLEMNKIKATELLRSHDADVTKAINSWLTASS